MAVQVAKSGTARKSRVERLNNPRKFSHGTLECESLAASRPFYEEFLGLDCVRHAERAMMIRKGSEWGLVCLEVGKGKVRPPTVRNHWGIDLEDREAVDRAHALAHEHKDRYGIRKILRINENHGTYAFYFQDRDGNWWEFQSTDRDRYDNHFKRGDIIPM